MRVAIGIVVVALLSVASVQGIQPSRLESGGSSSLTPARTLWNAFVVAFNTKNATAMSNLFDVNSTGIITARGCEPLNYVNLMAAFTNYMNSTTIQTYFPTVVFDSEVVLLASVQETTLMGDDSVTDIPAMAVGIITNTDGTKISMYLEFDPNNAQGNATELIGVFDSIIDATTNGNITQFADGLSDDLMFRKMIDGLPPSIVYNKTGLTAVVSGYLSSETLLRTYKGTPYVTCNWVVYPLSTVMKFGNSAAVVTKEVNLVLISENWRVAAWERHLIENTLSN